MNRTNPLISVIVPVYKVEPLLSKCVDSLLCQTLNNIEIILVDDGSPDNCGKICDEYALKDDRVNVIHKENGGLSSARNAGLDVFNGEYIMFVDSDDYVEPTFCAEALKIVCENQVKCASFGYYSHFDNSTTIWATKKAKLTLSEDAIRSLITYDDMIFNLAWNKIYHRRLFENIRFPVGMHYEDQGTTYKLIDSANKIYVSSIPLYHYVRRKDSISQTNSVQTDITPKNINDIFDLWYERLQLLKIKYPKLVHLEYEQIINHVLRGMRILSWKENKGIIRKFKRFLSENEKEVKSLHLNSYTLKLYYSCYPLFKLSLFVYRLKYK